MPSPRTSSKRAEALGWLDSNPQHSAFASAAFGDTNNALRYVEELYDAGATLIEVAEIHDEPWRIAQEGGPYASALIVTIPQRRFKSVINTVLKYGCPDEFDEVGRNKYRLWWGD